MPYLKIFSFICLLNVWFSIALSMTFEKKESDFEDIIVIAKENDERMGAITYSKKECLIGCSCG